ncbi:hypothetical protein EAO01_26925 [Klebsiella pneumoniae]|nr:hypothetical protein EAO01_26925 [Klebsiella pneumoniae]
MDGVIRSQQLISRPVRVRTTTKGGEAAEVALIDLPLRPIAVVVVKMASSQDYAAIFSFWEKLGMRPERSLTSCLVGRSRS